jgi:hypothetical protein
VTDSERWLEERPAWAKCTSFLHTCGQGSGMAVSREQTAVWDSFDVEELRLLTVLKVRIIHYVPVEIYAEI